VVILSAISFVIIAITYMSIQGAKNPKAEILKSMGSGQRFTGFNKMLEKKKKYEERKKNLN
jgi:hypothetical protein